MIQNLRRHYDGEVRQSKKGISVKKAVTPLRRKIRLFGHHARTGKKGRHFAPFRPETRCYAPSHLPARGVRIERA
jgi:hypothetical protein